MQAELVISDAMGRMVQNGNVFVMQGENRIPMHVDLNAGVYTIELRTEKSSHSTKLIVE
jgi:hypothetical protein